MENMHYDVRVSRVDECKRNTDRKERREPLKSRI